MPKYEPWLAGKASIKPFSKVVRESSPLELIYSDIYGPMNVKAHHGVIYLTTLINDYSRYGYVHLLSHRYEALDVFKCFIAEVETQLERRVKILQIDRGLNVYQICLMSFMKVKEYSDNSQFLALRNKRCC